MPAINKRFKNDAILCFGDDHSGFNHKDALPFLAAVKSEVTPDRVVHVGDLLDQFNFSQYPKDPEHISTNDELKGARKYVKQLVKLFPEVLLCESNHDSRLWARARSAGIPRDMLLPYLQLIGADHGGWKLKRDYTLTVDSTREQIYFTHYRGANILTVAQLVGCSAVQGHLHSRMSISEMQTPNRSIFGMQLPCLIDDNSKSFAYNKMGLIRPILGCGLIIEGRPKLIRMNLKKSGSWDGRLLI